MNKNTVLLVGGIVVTLLFIIFSTQIFEALCCQPDFSNEMYNDNLNLISAVITSAVAWGLAAIYYYVVNSVSFSRWYHWLIVGVVAMLLSPTIVYFTASSTFDSVAVDYRTQLFAFCFFDLIIEGLLFIVASYSIRWWSSNCRHTPIPE